METKTDPETSPDQNGSVLGGVLLVSGCCIGAGMLGIPLASALGGFKPTILLFIISWLFMCCTGLLLLEVNLRFNREVNIISMAQETLGTIGKYLAGGLFLFLFYSLMVAYLDGCGAILVGLLKDATNIDLPPVSGTILSGIILGLVLFAGTRAVDYLNRFLMIGLIISYVALVAMGIEQVNVEYFSYERWGTAFFALPAMVISFGFHNLVPSLTTYLNRDVSRLRKVFIIGSAIPLVVYLIWEAVILGIVPVEGPNGFIQSVTNGDMITKTLRNTVGSAWVVNFTEYFGFFAIFTSFLAVGLSFVDFLRDGLKLKNNHTGKFIACILVIVPPFILGLIYPNIFLVALNYAGAFGAVILFGLLPAIMVWKGRYYSKDHENELVPGGKFLLLFVILFSFFVMGVQLTHDLM